MNLLGFYRVLSDLALLLHFMLVLFVVIGLILILIGWLLRWRWPRHIYFRLTHSFVVLFVMIEDWLKVTCPLTALENWLRRKAQWNPYDASFLAHYLGQIQSAFYGTPHWVFVAVSSALGVMVLATLIGYPPLLANAEKRNGAKL
ncbi:MAG: DUF2784 domain-containing protein [Gammaproteobacteria bacterium]